MRINTKQTQQEILKDKQKTDGAVQVQREAKSVAAAQFSKM